MKMDSNELQELQQLFVIDSSERLDEMEAAAVALEANPDNQESLMTLYRLAHGLKGGAGLAGLPAVAEFAHTMENLLQGISGGLLPITNRLITLLLLSIDSLRKFIPAAVAGNTELDHTDEMLKIQMEQYLEMAKEDADGAAKIPATVNDDVKTVTVENDNNIEAVAEDGEDSKETSATAIIEEATARYDDRHIDENQYVEVDKGESETQTSRQTQTSTATKSAGARGPGEGARTLRVDIDKLDRLLNLTGEIAIARGRLTEMLTQASDQVKDDVIEAQRSMDPLYMELQELVMKARMVPVGPTFRQYARTVRDVASANAKQARLSLEGEDVEVDMTVIEHLRDPLIHMIRNSIDHGIEMPDARETKGKDPCGTIILRAYHESGSLVIQITDDGAGLNRQKIIDRAKSHNLAAEPEKLSEQELFHFIFHPGFSTAEAVTDLSGRGVGMDVVRRNIELLHGYIHIASQPDQGTTITIRVPLTLSIISGLKVGVADQTYIIPMDNVLECIELSGIERERISVEGVISVRGRPLPYLRLKNFFGGNGSLRQREYVVVVHHNGDNAGVAVDHLYGESQTVIKSLGKLFQGVSGIAGSAILGNGEVALILDIGDLLRKAPSNVSAMVV